MLSSPSKQPYTVMTVSCVYCDQEQVLQILARTGFWFKTRQSAKCLKCSQKFEVMPSDAIIGGPLLPQRTAKSCLVRSL
jgi:hypothetical protein